MLFDDGGVAVGAITGLHLQRVGAVPASLDDACFELEWRLAEPVSDEGRAAPPMNWVVLADRGGFGDALAQQLEAAGGRAVLVDREADLAVVLAEAAATGDLRGLVLLWGLDAADPLEGSRREVEQAFERFGCLACSRRCGSLA